MENRPVPLDLPQVHGDNSPSWSGYGGAAHDDKPHDECGVFGIYSPGQDVANITYFGLYALQHRGQESAGITVSDGQSLNTVKDMGLVAQVFDQPNILAGLRGDIALGHTRYSTTGSNKLANAQPMLYEHPQVGPIAIGHNGNLTNYHQLRDELEAKGVAFETSSDTEVILRLIGQTPGADVSTVLRRSLPRLEGAYTLVFLTRDSLIGVRDSLGVRPLCLGQYEDGWVLASETCALDTVRAKFVRDIEPGEVVVIDKDGVHSFMAQISLRKAACMFEFIYFARPDSQMMGKNLYEARRRMGQELARQRPTDADVVISLPDSGTPAAHGFAEESGIPFREGLIKSRYITRTFIQPSQSLREAGIRLKFNPVRPVLEGKRVVIVDDSIVRGNTSRQIVELLRWAGAKEVHMRIAAPPLHYPCFMGIDIGSKKELIAVGRTEEEIRDVIGADTLSYLKMDGLVKAVGHAIDNFCLACFDGEYPVSVPVQLEMDKLSLEPKASMTTAGRPGA
ncbi:MAG: amidophosphoribosyltransferase [Chloroflexota bacterium]|jgi:amidophosphoribosyltransferase|nr:amidophosphoribosyltransferase [Chloroflexota bacterium]